jgi:hypothetical protein
MGGNEQKGYGGYPVDADAGMVKKAYTPDLPLPEPDSRNFITGPSRGDPPPEIKPYGSHGQKIYDKKELGSLIDALNRIGISELALPPEFLGVRHAPKNYVLPKYPTNTLPEDVRFSL